MAHSTHSELLQRLQTVGLTLCELIQVELMGGSVTEGFMKTFLIRLGKNYEDIVTGQTPDCLQRLQELELLGKNPQAESQLDMFEMMLGISNPNRLKMPK